MVSAWVDGLHSDADVTAGGGGVLPLWLLSGARFLAEEPIPGLKSVSFILLGIPATPCLQRLFRMKVFS